MIKIFSRTLLSMMACTLVLGAAVADEPKHFDPKGKLPSKHTRDFQVQQRQILPLSDKTDFDEQSTGIYCQAGLHPDHGGCRKCCLGHGALRVPA